jgi:hypothetical protein
MKNLIFIVLLTATIFTSFLMILTYPGSSIIAFSFALISLYAFFDCFKQDTLFFERFINIFLFLGFYFKFTALVFIKKMPFSASLQSIDDTLSMSIIGLAAICCIKIIRRFFYRAQYSNSSLTPPKYLFNFYNKNRKFLILNYLLIIFLIPLLNYALGIYQRGMNPTTILPLKLNSIFEWLILFGLSSISSFIVYFEIVRRKKINVYILLAAILQNFNSSISMLSRGMIFNAITLFVGIECFLKKLKSFNKEIFLGLLFLTITYAISIKIVEEKRIVGFSISQNETLETNRKEYINNYFTIIYQRWVGIEELLMVVNKAEKISLLDSLKERANNRQKSNFDSHFSDPNLYNNINTDRNHYISTPGLFAFSYYSKSILIFISIIFSVVSIFTCLEIFISKIGINNILFTALIGQVLAFRIVHFGYAPLDTYKLIIAVIFNAYIFVFLNNLLKKKAKY